MVEKYMWPEEVYKKYGTLALSYIQDNIYLVDANDFNKLYSQIGDMGIVANVTAILRDSDLSNSDFSAAENLSASRFDDSTVWPENEYLPEDFDSSYSDDLSSLKDDDDFEPSDY